MAMPHRIWRRQASLPAIGSTCVWIAVGACNGDDTAPTGPTEPDTVVDSIWVAPSERTVGVLGTQFRVGAVALTEDDSSLYGSNLEPGRFSWSSSAPDIATVEATSDPHIEGRELRLVTGVSEGTAIIAASSQGVTGSMTVNVRDRARLAWSVPLSGGSTMAGIAIGADGTIYVGTRNTGAQRRLWYALSPDGSTQWAVDLPRTGHSAPAIGEDGTLYLGSWSDQGFSGSLIAVGPEGTIRWELGDLDAIWSSPAIGPDGTIIVAASRHLYAVDPQGTIQWTYERDERTFVFSSPAVASDGTIYVGGVDHALHAIGPDGSKRWSFETDDLIQSSPAIGTDGTIYFGSEDGRLYAVYPDGTERWSVEVDSRGVHSSPSIGADGTIYVGGAGVYAVDPGGSIRWHYPSSQVTNTPILGENGTVYVATGPGVTAFDAEGDLFWGYTLDASTFGSPAIGFDGSIIVASFEGTVHSITETGSANGGYHASPWPTARGDRANSGRAGG